MNQPDQNTEVVVDYAKPCMDAERALKDAHNDVMEHDLDAALNQTMCAIINARLMYSALRHMKEKNEKTV